jgi:hypothetical protein
VRYGVVLSFGVVLAPSDAGSADVVEEHQRSTVAAIRSGGLSQVGMLSVAPALAQGQAVRIIGSVQWIAAEKMVVIPDDGGLPIDVDITQVDQSQYEALTEGSPVVVVGVVSPDGRRVIASSIRSPNG